MGKISLEGMEFYAYHGVYPEERVIGNSFVVDVFIDTNWESASMSDNLDETINYETIYQICQAEMRHTVQLIETLIQNISYAIRRQFSTIQTITIKVRKNRPIPGHRVSHSAVESTENFVNQCPRCQKSFICYGDETCWCFEKKVSSETRENLKTRFQGCLCNECLSFFAG